MTEKEQKLEKMRHTTAHIMAQAVLRLFPEAQLGIGPAIADGFYYDFKLEKPLIPEDLKKIEKEIFKIKKENLPLEKQKIRRDQAVKYFKERNQPFKVELIKEIPKEEKIILFKQGDFWDLCEGPHLTSTGEIGEYKLTSIAGAYWKGSEQNPQLQRIYGTAFETKKELDQFLEKLAKAKESDHRLLGKTLDLYSISEEIGPGLVLWHPKGAVMRAIIEDFWRKEHLKRGYQLVYTPHIARASVWKKSGHLDYFSEEMFKPFGVDSDQYLVKPMNCPFHIEIYRSQQRSYRDLPLKLTELGTVYRYERSGVLQGLVRVRGFTQDDAHIFCTQEQIAKEIEEVLKFAQFMLSQFGFRKFKVFLSTKPEKFTGNPKMWSIAEKTLSSALKNLKIDFEKKKGEGAFYGPKIDFNIEDALGNFWQGPTIQLDFVEPEKFDLNYISENNRKLRPIMIHRVVLGALERFFGLLIEHYKGAFPVWLAPVQVKIIPVAERHIKFGEKIIEKLRSRGGEELRVELDRRSETVSKKIRDAELEKIPFILVVGDKEEKSGNVAVRERSKGDLGQMNLDEFLEKIKE